jgi:glycosyltransferase involved in cell wall biosynthesis
LSGFEKTLMIATEFPPGPGGIGNHAFNLAKYLRLNDFDVSVLTVSDFTDTEQENGFDRKQKFSIRRFKRYGSRIKTYRKRIDIIKQTLRKEHYANIIFTGRFSLMVSNLLRSYKKNAKFISIVHGGDVNATNPIEKYFITRALKRSDLIVPVSNYSGSFISGEIDRGKVKVIPNGFDFENIEELVIKAGSLRNGTLNLVTVGTVWPRKGHHNVCRSLPGIISRYPEVKYNIIGRLADLSKVKRFFEDEKLKDHIIVHGSVPNNEMQEILNSSQIFILLSESQSSGDFEGFGIAVIEANFFGLPAIGSKGSGLEDSINNGVSGILVDPKNSDEVINAVKEINENYEAFSEGARKWAAQHHWSEIIKRYIKAIESIN